MSLEVYFLAVSSKVMSMPYFCKRATAFASTPEPTSPIETDLLEFLRSASEVIEASSVTI